MIAGGLILLGLFVLAGRVLGAGPPVAGMATAARWFIPVWLVGAGSNMYVGVARRGIRWPRRRRYFSWCLPSRRLLRSCSRGVSPAGDQSGIR